MSSPDGSVLVAVEKIELIDQVFIDDQWGEVHLVEHSPLPNPDKVRLLVKTGDKSKVYDYTPFGTKFLVRPGAPGSSSDTVPMPHSVTGVIIHHGQHTTELQLDVVLTDVIRGSAVPFEVVNFGPDYFQVNVLEKYHNPLTLHWKVTHTRQRDLS